MAKVTFIFIIATILFAVNSHPVEENVGTAKITPLVAAEAQQKQNETTETQNPKKTDDSNNDSSSDSSESTEQTYIQETFIEVLLPGLPQPSSTELEGLLNKTANSTDNKDRSKRNSDSSVDSTSSNEKPSVPGNVHGSSSNEKNLEHKPEASSSSTAAPASYQLRQNLNPRPVRSASSNEKPNVPGNVHGSSSNEKNLEHKPEASSSSTAAPASYQLRQNLNTRPVRSASSNEKPNVPGNVHGSSSNEKNLEHKPEASSSSTAAPASYQLRQNLNKRPVRSASSEESSKEKENSSSNEDSSENKSKSSSNHTTGASVLPSLSTSNARQVREAVESKNHEAPKTDFAKTQTQSSKTNVGSPLYSARNPHSRPARQVSEKDDKSPSTDTKTPGLQSAPNNKDQKTDLLTEKSKSSKNVAPVPYSARNENVRKLREVVDSSESDSSNTTEEPVVYVTPQSRSLGASKIVSKEETASASPAAAADSSKSVEER